MAQSNQLLFHDRDYLRGNSQQQTDHTEFPATQYLATQRARNEKKNVFNFLDKMDDDLLKK